MTEISELFTDATLTKLFPPEKADNFFEALFGDANEGAYDISLKFITYAPDDKELHFELHLTERPNKCLACNLTYGLPEVFSRHPVINLNGLVEDINSTLDGLLQTKSWSLKNTRTLSSDIHAIPFIVTVE